MDFYHKRENVDLYKEIDKKCLIVESCKQWYNSINCISFCYNEYLP